MIVYHTLTIDDAPWQHPNLIPYLKPSLSHTHVRPSSAIVAHHRSTAYNHEAHRAQPRPTVIAVTSQPPVAGEFCERCHDQKR